MEDGLFDIPLKILKQYACIYVYIRYVAELTVYNFHELVTTASATHKHDTTVRKLQINKCCKRLFELYLTDTFQREVTHCSGSYESIKK